VKLEKDRPTRRCIVCKRSANKSDLLRLVLAGNGVCYDREQKLSGRGAYVHKSVSCVTALFAKGQLERAFRTGKLKLTDARKQEIARELMSVVETDSPGVGKKSSLRL